MKKIIGKLYLICSIIHGPRARPYYITYTNVVKLRVNATPQDGTFVNAAAQNNLEGIYSLLQPLEENDTVYKSLSALKFKK